MDVNQKRLKTLLAKIDLAFEDYMQHPESEDYAQAYEDAKLAAERYMCEMRISMDKKRDH